ncbi:integrase [Chromatiales bacterium (ex Bugula neritina AB1)]|nr:integrase [Chromatiales bacterium (ex Bugula neritina AB1)]
MGRRRGQLTMSDEREQIISLVSAARDAGARQSLACDIIGISAKTLQRWCQSENEGDQRLDTQREPANKLTELERRRILKVANEPEYAHLSPAQMVPILADEGRYIASESTIYRILKSEKQLAHRQKAKPVRQVKKPKALTATGPNQIYSWDITYLPTAVKGVFFYLYLVMDIYSRKIVGWQIHEEEGSALAADLMIDICRREAIGRDQVTLHSDNGSPMKGATMLATLQQLGIMPSFSRPSVSDDNPYSESLFRTLKYRPDYPDKPFFDLQSARAWVEGFTEWYNNKHRHSAIKFVSPAQRHAGEDIQILSARHQVYVKAKSENPLRWSGETRNWNPIKEVHLNPEKQVADGVTDRAA